MSHCLKRSVGHSDPGFTLRTYVHLLPEDLPEPGFLDGLTAATKKPVREHETGTVATAISR